MPLSMPLLLRTAKPAPRRVVIGTGRRRHRVPGHRWKGDALSMRHPSPLPRPVDARLQRRSAAHQPLRPLRHANMPPGGRRRGLGPPAGDFAPASPASLHWKEATPLFHSSRERNPTSARAVNIPGKVLLCHTHSGDALTRQRSTASFLSIAAACLQVRQAFSVSAPSRLCIQSIARHSQRRAQCGPARSPSRGLYHSAIDAVIWIDYIAFGFVWVTGPATGGPLASLVGEHAQMGGRWGARWHRPLE